MNIFKPRRLSQTPFLVCMTPLADTDGVPIGKTLSGEMVHLDLWGRETENWNVLVVGSSGTGKSFTINQLLIKNLADEPLRHDYRQIPIL